MHTLAVLAGMSAPALAQPPSTTDEAWAAYDAAFTKAERGDREQALDDLRSVSARFPGHPAALRAADLVKEHEPTPADPNGPSKLARGELVFWSTLSGVSIGYNICAIAECDSPRAYAAVYMSSVGGALAASVLLTRDGVREGQAQLYNSGQTWGSWNALAVNDGFAESSTEAATALGMQAAGLGVGLVLWENWRPSQGDVALTNTTWVWSSVVFALTHAAADSDSLSLRRVVIAGDVALVAGMALSTQIEMSRGRTLLIDVGGVLGFLGGALIATGVDSGKSAAAAMAIGTVAGLGAGVAFSSDWDAPKTPAVTPSPIAGPQSTGVGLATGFRF